MARSKELVDTEFGTTNVWVDMCDWCGGKQATDATSSFRPPRTWYRLAWWDVNVQKHMDTEVQQDFCSMPCLLSHLAPHLDTSEKEKLKVVVEDLRTVVRDLAAR